MFQERTDRKYYHRIIRTLKPFAKAVSRTTIIDEKNIPSAGGVIIAPNHLSNIDPVLLGVKLATRREVYALAKESLFRVPLVGQILQKMGHIPVHRGTASAGDSLIQAKKIIELGGAVAIYPEGTILAGNSGQLGELKTGVARLAQQTGLPVVPVGQWGAQDIMPTGSNPLSSVLRAIFTRPRCNIRVGSPIFYEGFDTLKTFNDALAERIKHLTEEARRGS